MNHCVKSVRTWSFSGPYFPAFELNTERYGVSPCILFECGKIKIRTRKTLNTDTIHAVNDMKIRVQAPKVVANYISTSELFSRSGHILRGEGGDYVT